MSTRIHSIQCNITVFRGFVGECVYGVKEGLILFRGCWRPLADRGDISAQRAKVACGYGGIGVGRLLVAAVGGVV